MKWIPLFVALVTAQVWAQESNSHLRVLATHDLHGALQPVVYPWSQERPIGGAQALNWTMRKLTADCACATIHVDGGDLMQGTLESNLMNGAATVAFFNYLGLDAAAVGNHELDWGVDTLLQRQQEAGYAWLAANVFELASGERPAWARPYQMLSESGLRIAVIGYATIDTPATLRPSVTAPYEFRSGYAALAPVLDEVWSQSPDFVIIAAHAGGECRDDVCEGELVELAGAIPAGRVHMIAGGHDHSAGQGLVNGIPIVRAGANGAGVAVVDLYKSADAVTFTTENVIVYADVIEEDTQLAALLAPFESSASERAAREITTLADTLTSGRDGDRRLGELIADALRAATNADVGMQNSGGVRANLLAGPVTYGDLFRVLPFDNKLVTLTMTGSQLRALVMQAAPSYYYSNLHIVFDPALELSRQIRGVTFADGSPLIPDAQYTLATVDFLADGGDGLALLSTLPREQTGISNLDILITYIQTLEKPLTLPVNARRTRLP
jgi:2',3'-cyclic-nucleotide 2'-phosphodiesterase / 3'-nucleotidase / 5'-nucleotidase